MPVLIAVLCFVYSVTSAPAALADTFDPDQPFEQVLSTSLLRSLLNQALDRLEDHVEMSGNLSANDTTPDRSIQASTFQILSRRQVKISAAPQRGGMAPCYTGFWTAGLALPVHASSRALKAGFATATVGRAVVTDVKLILPSGRFCLPRCKVFRVHPRFIGSVS